MTPVVGPFLEAQGYRVYGNPDGSDYFDLAARRGDEIGLIELKLRQGGTVLYQALRRRAWGDWTAVGLGSERAARRLVSATTDPLRSAIGIWWVRPEGVEVLRPARPRAARAGSPALDDARQTFGEWLDRIDRGELPPGVRWEGLPREMRRVSGGRRFQEWTIEEAAELSREGSAPQR